MVAKKNTNLCHCDTATMPLTFVPNKYVVLLLQFQDARICSSTITIKMTFLILLECNKAHAAFKMHITIKTTVSI